MVVISIVVATHRAHVISGYYGAVHTGGAEFEARNRGKVYLISFDMVIKIKLLNLKVPRSTVIYLLTVFVSDIVVPFTSA